jgi:prephenate dehydrogenase
MTKPRATIVGLGRIGGSLGLAMKKAKVDFEIVGHDKDPGVASRAQKRGAVDRTDWNLHGACEGAGLIILALPLGAIKDTLAALQTSVPPGVVVTDTATTKVAVMEWAKGLPLGVHFVGGNPALSPRRASQAHGIDAADADLFQGATYALVASPTAEPQAIQAVASLAEFLGAKPFFVDAAEHDGLTAGVQHLPAVLATILEAATMSSQGWRELAKLAGADYAAMTDLAPQDGRTAREQFLAHRVDLVRWIDTVQGRLSELRDLMQTGDADAIEKLVEGLADERAKWLRPRSDEPAVDRASVSTGIGRLFLGGLADRGKKK